MCIRDSCSRATEKIVLNIRLIKAIVALLAGAALSVSGLQMQTLFRNPLAGPYVLGISSGASLGVALVVLAGIGSSIGIDVYKRQVYNDQVTYVLFEKLATIGGSVMFNAPSLQSFEFPDVYKRQRVNSVRTASK